MGSSISGFLDLILDTVNFIFKIIKNLFISFLKFIVWVFNNPKRFIKFLFGISKRDLLAALTAIVIVITFIPVFTYMYFAKDLKTPDGIMNKNDAGVVLLDRNQKPFFTFYQARNRTYVPLNQIPKSMQQAIIAAEDREFYTNPGFSIKGIAGAMIANLKYKEFAYGGSTITQQLVKNSLLTSKKDFLRKYQEIILAQEIERRYGKDKILEMYLNSVYFGEGSFGIEEASQTYFGKPAKDLNLNESSILAGLVQSPSKYSPLNGDFNLTKKRQTFVLEQMVEQKYITEDQKNQALKQVLVFKSTPNLVNSIAPHFALMVKQQLIDKYGEEKIARSGFKVTTTLDLDWQKFAEKIVANQVIALAPNQVSNGAAVVEDPKTGEIRALVGSKDWFNDKYGKVNVAISNRQPGSSFKPLVYTAAFEKNIITPGTTLLDVPTTYKIKGSPDYVPQNYDRKFRGPVTPRRALANSYNLPAVEVMNKLGVPGALEFAQRLGLSTLNDSERYGISLVLGAGEVKLLEMTNAYSVFANSGIKYTPTLITKIDNKRKETVYQYIPKGEKVLQPEYAFIISDILSDNKARQEVFGNALTISRTAAVKTGTTNEYKDAWTIGYTPSLAIGVWVGNNDGKPMDQIAGSLGAAPIWKQLMEQFLKGTPVEKFEKPAGVVSKAICNNGKEASQSAQVEYFVKGTEPIRSCANSSSSRPSSAPFSSSSPSPSSTTTQPSENSSTSSNQPATSPRGGAYLEGGWYPVGPGGKALQYWKGQWFEKPQQ